jgi:Putative heavy-metal-binding
LAKILTATPFQKFEVLDCVFAMDAHKGGFLETADPSEAFNGVKQKLSDKCDELGGDAVIACHFEYRSAVDEGFFGHKLVLEIFGYGTAVRFL